jgi:hypothetical protein
MESGCDNGRGVASTVGTEQTGEDSSESDGETEPAKSFHRRLSTNREIKCAVSSVVVGARGVVFVYMQQGS